MKIVRFLSLVVLFLLLVRGTGLSCDSISVESDVTVAQLQHHVTVFVSSELEGREFGTSGAQKTARYIADTLKEWGLRPGGNDSGGSGSESTFEFATSPELQNPYFQLFHYGDRIGINVLAYIPGTDPEVAHELVVCCAHYDHLGFLPDGSGHFPGANDNASGVAVLLELARHFVQARNKGTVQLDRTIVFLFCDGEEKGLLGSRHFIRSIADFWEPIRTHLLTDNTEQPAISPTSQIVGALTLDMVGWLDNNDRLEIVGQKSGTTWEKLLHHCNSEGLLTLHFDPKMWTNSDHYAFYRAKVPTLLLFTGLIGPYHTPNDTPDLLSYPGMVKVLRLCIELVRDLCNSRSNLIPQWTEPTTAGPTSWEFCRSGFAGWAKSAIIVGVYTPLRPISIPES